MINLARFIEEYVNVIEIIKKAMVVELVEMHVERGEHTIKLEEFDTCMTATKPPKGEVYDITHILGALSGNYIGKMTDGQRIRIDENALLKEVIAIAVALQIHALHKEGDIYIGNALIYARDAECAGIADPEHPVDYMNLKGFLQKASALNNRTTAILIDLKGKVPGIAQQIEDEFSHIREPIYGGVRGCLPVLTLFALVGGSICMVYAILI